MCNVFFVFRETIARVTGGMKVKADRDEVGYLLFKFDIVLQDFLPLKLSTT